MILETSHLQTLSAISATGSFSKAAEKLNVTQSAISQSIKSLEKKVGVQLIKRSGKRITFTDEGIRLYEFADQFLGKMDIAINSITKAKEEMEGKVRIGTLSGIGKSWLAHEMMNFTKEHELLKTSIVLDFQENLVSMFEKNQLDLLILPEDAVPSNGVKEFLSWESSNLIYSSKIADKITPEMTLEEFGNLPTILFEEDDILYTKWCEKHFGARPKNVNTRYIINSHGNILHAVSEGLGVAIVPNHVLVRSHLKENLKIMDMKHEVVSGKFCIVYHQEARELKRIKATIEHLVSIKNPLSINLI